MSTRGLWGFRKNEEDKLTYNHCDSYPSGLGNVIKQFILNHNKKELSGIFDNIILVTRKDSPTEKQQKECKIWCDLGVSSRSANEWYCLLRHAQYNPESYFNGLKYMIDSHEFIKDSCMCEYAYIINLDTNKLEIYDGYQKTPQKNRYKSMIDGYGNCKLINEIDFTDLKDFDMDKLEI